MQQCLLKPVETSDTSRYNISSLRRNVHILQDNNFLHLDPESASQSLPISSFAYEMLSTPFKSTLPLVTVNKSLSKPSLYYQFPLRTPLAILAAKKKYKPVTLKTQPIMTELPECFRIICNIIGDPLASLPMLPKHLKPFRPHGRYTLERKEYIDDAHSGDFLWPVEQDLILE